MSNRFCKEKPFEYLRRKNGDRFSEETIKNWYVARAYVLEKLKNVAIGQGSKEHLQVVVTNDSPLMLSVVRHVALLAHFANFDETQPNRTIITIVSRDRQIVEELGNEEYLCNLPTYSKLSVNGSTPMNTDPYTDIELQIVETWQDSDSVETIMMSEDDIKAFLSNKSEGDIYSIDTRKAVLSQRMYSLGSWIDNLPAEDIHNFERYAMALNVFQRSLIRKPMSQLVDEKTWESDLTTVRNGLSSIFCSDCFESRAAGVKRYAQTQGKTEKEAWKECVEALSKSEHARWVVEKLIMGFRPLDERERMKDECLFGDEKRRYRNQLKKDPRNPVHIDVCSFAELRRINPYDMKYDSFLMLAIPGILKNYS